MLSKRVLLTALAPLAWGTTYLVTSQFLVPDAPLFTSVMRALPAGLLLLAFTRRLPRGRWWGRAAILGLLNVGAFFPLLFLGAYRLPGGVAATIGAVQPLVVIGLAAVLLAEPVRIRTVIAGLVGIGGVGLLVLTPAARLDAVGIMAAVGGAVVMAVGVVLTKRWMPPEGPLVMTAWQLSAGGVMLVPFALWEGIPQVSWTPSMIGGYLWLGLVGTVLAYVVWFRGIAELPAAVVTFLSLLTSVSATVIGWWVLGQELSSLQVLGGVLALGAVAVVSVKGRESQAPPGSMGELRRARRPGVASSA